LEIFTPNESDDPLLYDPYDISEEQMNKFNNELKEVAIYDNIHHDYTLAHLGSLPVLLQVRN
jgi:hypothetical protein